MFCMQMASVTVISGVVQQGRRLGRRLGFPTANVPAPEGVAHGIYATRTTLCDGRRLDGVASLGTNPTVGAQAPLLEVWLFDFDEDLYGQRIETELVAWLREERRFPDLDSLAEQVRRDAEAARRVLAGLAHVA